MQLHSNYAARAAASSSCAHWRIWLSVTLPAMQRC
jgi:hypothetical protein